MTLGRILLVDDDESVRRVTQLQLLQAGYEVATAADGREALQLLRVAPRDLIITDLQMPGISGIDLLSQARVGHPDTTVVLITAFGSIENAVEAMKAGAFDYLTKPVHPDELLLVVNRALERQRLLEEVRILRSNLDAKYGFEGIIGRSSALLHVLELAARAAQAESTVLIRGETGTGKELLAKAIHFNSPRKSHRFITINCAAIPRELLESELFGHAKGAFTGAVVNKTGKIEMAEGGTLFLDEIGELPLELQTKLLRLVQEREIDKIGAIKPTKVNVRVVAATHRPLEQMIAEGTFREDLYYRLAVIPLEIPALRERPEDIPELAVHLFHRCRQKQCRDELELPDSLLPCFTGYRWPGNIRELENVIERIVALSRGPQVTRADLPDFLRGPATEAMRLDLPPHGIQLVEVEREVIACILRRFKGSTTAAAAYFDIDREDFLALLEKHNLGTEFSSKSEVTATGSADQTTGRPASTIAK